MPRVDFSNMHYNAQEIIGAGTLQFHALSVISASNTISVGKHVELQRKIDWGVDLGRGMIMPALLIFETLMLLDNGLASLHL